MKPLTSKRKQSERKIALTRRKRFFQKTERNVEMVYEYQKNKKDRLQGGKGEFSISLLNTVFLATGLCLILACSKQDSNNPITTAKSNQCTIQRSAIISIKGGRFTMGDDHGYPEESPAREINVQDFSIDTTEVTNAQFSKFVTATGYVTQAERVPNPEDHPAIPAHLLKAGSAVFIPPSNPGHMNWWHFLEGASWKQPEGVGSNIDNRMEHPVVHISYADALAYAQWIGGDLPTEAEWEFAARAGLQGQKYEWGDSSPADLPSRANIWQGVFPAINTKKDGYIGTAPAGCFPKNDFGLYDMTGNVWEWTKGTFSAHDNNQGVIKGGSYLCAENFCRRFRPAARQPQERNFSTNHIGFRVVYRNTPAHSESVD